MMQSNFINQIFTQEEANDCAHEKANGTKASNSKKSMARGKPGNSQFYCPSYVEKSQRSSSNG